MPVVLCTAHRPDTEVPAQNNASPHTMGGSVSTPTGYPEGGQDGQLAR